ncbi:MAG: TIGR01777 family oxidoreductase [Acidobacteria bacterium]|nr:TIGR01777 family oxidoreductase [Acidobacteriota bacterium]
MNVLVSGSSGLIGSALVPALSADGHAVRRLRRAPGAGADATSWNPDDGTFAAGALDGLDAVVHLAGENIAGGRWTASRKSRIRDSRVEGTRRLCAALAALETPPRVLVAASAIGFYGDRGDALLDESAAPGIGFLPEVSRSWEAAAAAAREAGIRVVHLRIGIVLSPAGGALGQMLLPFKLGVGGVLGSGEQYMSWIALDDLVGIVRHALADESLSGPVNAVAPRAVTNREFTRTLGQVLRRPTILPAPAFALRIALGEMADALLLASTRVDPAALRGGSFEFLHPELDGALRQVLDRA